MSFWNSTEAVWQSHQIDKNTFPKYSQRNKSSITPRQIILLVLLCFLHVQIQSITLRSHEYTHPKWTNLIICSRFERKDEESKLRWKDINHQIFLDIFYQTKKWWTCHLGYAYCKLALFFCRLQFEKWHYIEHANSILLLDVEENGYLLYRSNYCINIKKSS